MRARLQIDHVARETVEGLLQRLRQGWVGVHVACELERSEVPLLREGELGQKLRHIGADEVAADELEMFGIRDELHETDRLAEAAAHAGIAFLGDEAYGEGEPVTVDSSFLELAERKGYSVLAAISDEAYEKGLDRLRTILGPRPVTVSACGGTVHWLGKAGAKLG